MGTSLRCSLSNIAKIDQFYLYIDVCYWSSQTPDTLAIEDAVKT
jgi:hypothetical protein